eukprot:TRINITY_DN1335_c0_g1_i6.p1 TRINITY_DN1335_c0_g1~~TRINITY_DN1335_c0_g1_i6.p1  ORF type:complete len:177 (-),score=48.25 TRINITY_DN1335_c0_g1_i6:344-874(-)
MEILKSSPAVGITNIHGVLFSDDVCDVISSNALLEKMGDIMRSADDWENHVESNYPMKQGRIIHSLTTYLVNKFNGFDDRNDHKSYEEEIENDTDGLLMKEATVGLKLLKKVQLVVALYPFHYDCLEGYKKLKKKGKTQVKWPRILECALDSENMDCLLRIDIKLVRQEARRNGIF